MDRPIIYTDEGIRSFDHLFGWKDTMFGIGRAIQMLLGNTSTFYQGFAATQQSTPSLTINIGAGLLVSLQAADSTNYGSALPSDSTLITQQGYAPAQTLTLQNGGLAANQSQIVLVQAQFLQQDIIRPGDPTNGVPPFVNPSNLLTPLQGQNGLGGTSPTERNAFVQLSLVYGTPANSGTNPTAPTPSGNNVGLYQITLSYGQTAITNGEITPYANTPNLAGLLNQHHTGVPGQAPQIVLTNAQEVQGQLPAANCLAAPIVGSGSPQGVLTGKISQSYFDQVASVYYVCTVTGTTPSTTTWQADNSIKKGSGNPNGVVAGNAGTAPDLYVDVTGPVLYVCVTSGTATTAVWQSQATFPSGFIGETAAATPPAGWLLCDGTAYSRTTYAALFAAIGTAYGAGDGATTFNVPDSRGRVGVGVGTGGGATYNLGNTGGEATHTLSINEMPSHNHYFLCGLSASGAGLKNGGFSTESQEYTTSTGNGAAHNNMQPYYTATKMIKT